MRTFATIHSPALVLKSTFSASSRNVLPAHFSGFAKNFAPFHFAKTSFLAADACKSVPAFY